MHGGRRHGHNLRIDHCSYLSLEDRDTNELFQLERKWCSVVITVAGGEVDTSRSSGIVGARPPAVDVVFELIDG